VPDECLRRGPLTERVGPGDGCGGQQEETRGEDQTRSDVVGQRVESLHPPRRVGQAQAVVDQGEQHASGEPVHELWQPHVHHLDFLQRRQGPQAQPDERQSEAAGDEPQLAADAGIDVTSVSLTHPPDQQRQDEIEAQLRGQ